MSYVVTGASRGIGLELVKQLSAVQGNTVFAVVRTPSEAGELNDLAKQASNLIVIEGDITDIDTLKKAQSEIARRSGGAIDVLINNAAINPGEQMGLSNVDPADLNLQLSANVTGPVQATQIFLPLLRNGKQKTVAFIGSISGSLTNTTPEKDPSSFMASYAVAKAALNMVVRKFANELLKDGFTVLSLHPGWVSTRMGGPQAPLTPKESVTNLLKTLEVNSKPASTGKFYQYDGEQVPW